MQTGPAQLMQTVLRNDTATVTCLCQQHIGGLEVPVDDAAAVQECHATRHINRDAFSCMQCTHAALCVSSGSATLLPMSILMIHTRQFTHGGVHLAATSGSAQWCPDPVQSAGRRPAIETIAQHAGAYSVYKRQLR